MAQLEVDFEVWKALTARRESEAQTYNDVLRTLLGLPTVAPQASPPLTARMILKNAGRFLGGRYLPDGTQLRAKYKGGLHHAEIANGKLTFADGSVFASASAAARAVTKTNVNGLAFWEVRRPNDNEWQKLLELPRFDQ